MFDLFSNIVALIMNPISLMVFLIVMRYLVKKMRKRDNSQWWASHQGRGV